AGSVARAQLRREHWVHRQREEASRGGYAITADNYGAVVQRSARTEDGRQQVIRQLRVESDAAFDIGAKADFPLDDHEGSGLILREEVGRHNYVVIGVGFRTRAVGESEPPAKTRQGLTYLGSKNYDERENGIG